MKSIKLGSAAVNTTKPFIIAMPTVVKPAVVRNVALDLRAVEKNNPNTGICITDEKLEAMSDNLKDKLASMESANLISVETLFNPEEYFKSNIEDIVSDLFIGVSSSADLSVVDSNISVPQIVSFVASDGYIHRENKRIDFAINWEFVGEERSESFQDIFDRGGGSYVPTVLDSDIVNSISPDKSDPVYHIAISQPTDADYSFDLRATLSMVDSRLYAESDSQDYTEETDPVVNSWKASYTFHITVLKDAE